MVIVVMMIVRLLAIVTLRVGGYIAETGPDSTYHFQLGRLAASGAYPFVDYWVEYPPMFPWLSVLAYKIATLLPSWLDQRFWFNLVLHGLIIPFDAANAVLIYVLSRRINGHAIAIKSAWLYATLFVPMFVVLGWFESIALFAVLLALWAILSNRPLLAGVVIGLGVLVKPYVALAGAVGLIHIRPAKRIIGFIAAGAITLAVALSPFLIKSPQMLLAHVDTLLTLPGWSSPYALIDGVIKHVDPKLADRFDPALAANPIVPTKIPWGLVTLGFGLVYGATLIRSNRRQSARAAIGLAGFTFTLYLLWSKGYSPQWSLYLMAFLCILRPDLLGTLLLIILEALYVIEWPITFILLKADASYLTALIIIRTLVMLGIALYFGAMIFAEPDSPGWPRMQRWTRVGGVTALIAVIALTIGGLPLYAAQRYQADPLRNAVELIQSTSTPDRANILFDRVDTYERLTPYLQGWSTLAALQIGGAADAWDTAKIQAYAAERPELWYVLDYGADVKKDERLNIDRSLSESLCKVSTQFAGSAQVSRYIRTAPAIDLNVTAEFENGVQLKHARISATTISVGNPLCVELQWTTTKALSANYTVFIHVLDANGQLMAQSDLQPDGGFAPTNGWQVNQVIRDRHGVILPVTLPLSTYRVVMGVYGLDGVRLKSGNSDDSVLLSELTIR